MKLNVLKMWLSSFLLALLVAPVFAAPLDGHTVILVMSKDGQAETEVLRQKLLDTRKAMGFSKVDIPIVFMTFDKSETEKEYAQRLGINSQDAPVMCVVEWGEPAHHGPKRVVDGAITRMATSQQVDSMLVSYLKATHTEAAKTPEAAVSTEVANDLAPGALDIESFRFEASGKPSYLANAGIRINNADKRTLRNIVVRFYSKLQEGDEWQLMEKQVIDKLPKGYAASRDFVGDTRTLKLIDEENLPIPCYFRIEVEQGGQVLSREGHFVPYESQLRVE